MSATAWSPVIAPETPNAAMRAATLTVEPKRSFPRRSTGPWSSPVLSAKAAAWLGRVEADVEHPQGGCRVGESEHRFVTDPLDRRLEPLEGLAHQLRAPKDRYGRRISVDVGYRAEARDRRVRRSGGLQRDHGRLWRCVGHRDTRALRGVGARGRRRVRAADQVDRRRGDVRIPRPGHRASGARTPASGVPIRATDSADEDRAQPRPGAPPGERSLWHDGQRRGTHRGVGVSGAVAGDPGRRRHCGRIRNRRAGHREGRAAIDRRTRSALCHRTGAGIRSRVDRSGVQDARSVRRRTAGPRRRSHGSVPNAAQRPIDGRRRPIPAKGRLRTWHSLRHGNSSRARNCARR